MQGTHLEEHNMCSAVGVGESYVTISGNRIDPLQASVDIISGCDDDEFPLFFNRAVFGNIAFTGLRLSLSFYRYLYLRHHNGARVPWRQRLNKTMCWI
jgi:hypothetical protein